VGGAYGGPFPDDGLIPFLQPLYDYSWLVGLAAGLLIYLGLTLAVPHRTNQAGHVTPTASAR
jgi:NCS1 family nucleobase:cation symporter-1